MVLVPSDVDFSKTPKKIKFLKSIPVVLRKPHHSGCALAMRDARCSMVVNDGGTSVSILCSILLASPPSSPLVECSRASQIVSLAP
jgi:hypothetical protein